MRNKLFTVLGGVLAFSAIAFVLLAFAQVREVSSSVSHPTPTVARTKQQTPVHVNSISITPIPPAPGVLPASAIRKYILTHRFEGGPTTTGNPSTILTLALVTSKEAATIMGGEQTGLPDDAQVYYILLRGQFVLDYMSLPPPEPGQPPMKVPTAETGDEVFDAMTGRVLVWGV
jgi:hypothetical protein